MFVTKTHRVIAHLSCIHSTYAPTHMCTTLTQCKAAKHQCTYVCAAMPCSPFTNSALISGSACELIASHVALLKLSLGPAEHAMYDQAVLHSSRHQSTALLGMPLPCPACHV